MKKVFVLEKNKLLKYLFYYLNDTKAMQFVTLLTRLFCTSGLFSVIYFSFKICLSTFIINSSWRKWRLV